MITNPYFKNKQSIFRYLSHDFLKQTKLKNKPGIPDVGNITARYFFNSEKEHQRLIFQLAQKRIILLKRKKREKKKNKWLQWILVIEKTELR